MRILHERTSDRIEPLTEQTATGKKLYIEGPFLMADSYNRNRRKYAKSVMEQSVEAYINEYINERRALGELNHPEYPFPDPDKAALITKSLVWQGNDVIGKAQILDNVQGQKIKALIDADFNLGVSSRGLGEVTENRDGTSDVVQFVLNAIDAVDMPSGQTCYVNAVNESHSWVEKNGVWIREMAKDHPGSKPERLIEALDELFKSLRNKHAPK